MRIGSHCHGHSVMNLHHLLSQQAVKFSLSYAEPRVTIRLTDTEFSIIENTAEQADMTISEYMRKQIMEGQVNTKFEVVADVKEIKKLIGELGKIGSNLNQIARYFNQGGIISSEMRTEIKKSLRDIYEMKYEVMRMAGDFGGSD